MKRDLTKIFIGENKSPMGNYPTNKIIYNHIYEIWSIDSADAADYETSNNKGYRYILIIKDTFSKYLWALPLKNTNSHTIRNEFSNNLTTSKRKPLRIESDRGAEVYNSIFQNFSKSKNIHHYSRFADIGPSIAEQVSRTVRNLLKKPKFQQEMLIGYLNCRLSLRNITIQSTVQ